MNAGPEMAGRAAQLLQAVPHLAAQVIEIQRKAVGQPALGESPDPFVRVQFRGVGWEVFQVEARETPTQLADRRPFVRADVVPHHDDVPAEVPEQVTQEPADLGLADIPGVDLEEEAQPPAARTDRDPGDHRKAVVPVPVIDDRCDPAGSPGSAAVRDQEEARLVGEDEMGTQPRGVFFTRGQLVCFHLRMRGSFRSRARRSGVWGVQPIWCSRRPTWSG